MTSLPFVFVRVRSEIGNSGEFLVASLSWRSLDVGAKGRGATPLSCGIAFLCVPDVEVSFATLGISFAELEVVAFAEVFAVVELITGGEVRGLTAVGTLALIAFTSNPVCAIPFVCFPTGFFPCEDDVGFPFPGVVFSTELASASLSSDSDSS